LVTMCLSAPNTREMGGGINQAQILIIHFPSPYVLNMAVLLVFMCHGGVLDKMLDVLMWATWSVLGVYGFWFVTRAKRSQPMTLDELVVLWKMHKQQARCNTPLSSMKPIMNAHSKDFSGFRCKCGYEYQSKRLIVQRHALDHNMFSRNPPSHGEQSSILKT
jgi:hypothetical protein